MRVGPGDPASSPPGNLRGPREISSGCLPATRLWLRSMVALLFPRAAGLRRSRRGSGGALLDFRGLGRQRGDRVGQVLWGGSDQPGLGRRGGAGLTVSQLGDLPRSSSASFGWCLPSSQTCVHLHGPPGCSAQCNKRTAYTGCAEGPQPPCYFSRCLCFL